MVEGRDGYWNLFPQEIWKKKIEKNWKKRLRKSTYSLFYQFLCIFCVWQPQMGISIKLHSALQVVPKVRLRKKYEDEYLRKWVFKKMFVKKLLIFPDSSEIPFKDISSNGLLWERDCYSLNEGNTNSIKYTK